MKKTFKRFAVFGIPCITSFAFAGVLADAGSYLSRMCEANITISNGGEIKIIGKSSFGSVYNLKFNLKNTYLVGSETAGGFPRFYCKGGRNCISEVLLEDTSDYVEKPPIHTYSDTSQILACNMTSGRVDEAFRDLDIHFNGRPKPQTKYD